jgi:MinD-like ATPase involved in chromosome partitioning or flagellar assembly
MLNALIVSPDAATAASLERIAAEAGFIRVKKSLVRTLQPYESVRMSNADDIDILFLDFVDPDHMPFNEEAAESLNRWTAVIGFSSARPDLHHNPLPGLVQGWLSLPLTESGFLRQVIDVTNIIRERTEEQLFAVLPAKAGSGASTVALHLARLLGERLAKDVLLVDGDLRSGVLATLLNQKPESGLREALRAAADLTPALWNSLILRLPRVHLLASPPARDERPFLPHWTDYYKLIMYIRQAYSSVIIDLPELVNEATAEVVRCAEQVLVVTSAEIASLTLAGQRCAELDRAGVRPNRIGIVLNRWHRGDMSIEDIENMLERRVAASIPNNYRQVQAAAVEGGFVRADSELGRAYDNLAGVLLHDQAALAIPGAFSKARRGIRAWFG